MNIEISYWRIGKNVIFNMTPISKPWAIAYSSEIKTFILTHFNLIKDRCKILAVFDTLIKNIMELIDANKSRLLIKDELVKSVSCSHNMSS